MSRAIFVQPRPASRAVRQVAGAVRTEVGAPSPPAPRVATLLLVEAELLDLARDRVAADAQLVRRLDAAAARQLERGTDELRLELARERVPDHRLTRIQQLAGAPLEPCAPIGVVGLGRAAIDASRGAFG